MQWWEIGSHSIGNQPVECLKALNIVMPPFLWKSSCEIPLGGYSYAILTLFCSRSQKGHSYLFFLNMIQVLDFVEPLGSGGPHVPINLYIIIAVILLLRSIEILATNSFLKNIYFNFILNISSFFNWVLWFTILITIILYSFIPIPHSP